jgi:hypothetical protein
MSYQAPTGTDIYVKETDDIFCEPTGLYNKAYFGIDEDDEINISKVDAECGKNGDEPIRCTCAWFHIKLNWLLFTAQLSNEKLN